MKGRTGKTSTHRPKGPEPPAAGAPPRTPAPLRKAGEGHQAGCLLTARTSPARQRATPRKGNPPLHSGPTARQPPRGAARKQPPTPPAYKANPHPPGSHRAPGDDPSAGNRSQRKKQEINLRSRMEGEGGACHLRQAWPAGDSRPRSRRGPGVKPLLPIRPAPPDVTCFPRRRSLPNGHSAGGAGWIGTRR